MKTTEIVKIAKRILKKEGAIYVHVDSQGYKITVEKVKTKKGGE